MNFSVSFPKYFRVLLFFSIIVMTLVSVYFGFLLKWTAFSRVLGTMIGTFFPIIVLLEILAFLSERFWLHMRFSRATVVSTCLWTLLVLIPFGIGLTEELAGRIRWQGQTSIAIVNMLPDDFGELCGNSLMIVSVWLVPIGLLSGIVGVLKRLKKPHIQGGLILWMASALVVLGWNFLLAFKVRTKNSNVLEYYFNPFGLHGKVLRIQELGGMLSFVGIIAFWCMVFLLLVYVVKHFGYRESGRAWLLMLLLATALILLPPTPPMLFKEIWHHAWIRSIIPLLLAQRIWIGSLFMVGGVLTLGGLFWKLKGEKTRSMVS